MTTSVLQLPASPDPQTPDSLGPSDSVDVAASASREPAGLIASRVIFALLVSGRIIH